MATASEVCYYSVTAEFPSKADCHRIVAFRWSMTVGEGLASFLEDIGEGHVIAEIRAGAFEVEESTPAHILNTLGHKQLRVRMKPQELDTVTVTDSNNNQEKNAFDILKLAGRQYCTFPEYREEQTQKDVIHNKVIDALKTNGVGFTPMQVESTGKFVVKSLTTVLWFMDGRHDKFEQRGVTLPKMFESLRGYRSYKAQHQKIPEITFEDLQEQINLLGEMLMLPWIMNKRFADFKANIRELCGSLQKYRDFLKKMKSRYEKNKDRSSPVRNLNDSWALKTHEAVMPVEKKYKTVIDRLSNVGLYEPVDLCDLEPAEKEERRKWLSGMNLPFPTSRYTYRYGNYLGNLNMIWKVPIDIRERKSSKEIQLVQDILGQVTKFKTRKMHKDFIDRYRNFAKPSILRNMFHYLTDYEYSPANTSEKEIDLRFCEYLLQSENHELIFDLRKNNGRPFNNSFNRFWEELDKYLDEKSVVHERRTNDINYMPFAMSVEDLRDIIKERIPADCAVPSVSWIKLNFSPSNPYKHSAERYTGKFKVKFHVQQRLLRVQHVDGEYCRNLFFFMKTFASKFREHSLFHCLDDKAIVPIGEPHQPVSTGVRIHHGGLVAHKRDNIALDHDFHVSGVIPSVCFLNDIPESPHDSFYNGVVHVTVKDKVFEASSPLRHAAETVSLLRDYCSEDNVNLNKPILIRYTDGGPDHRNTYRAVQLCCLAEFIALDLDMLVVARTAPHNSYVNPAERCMSVLNLALQNVSLQREKMSPEYELIAKNKSLKGLRNAAERNENFRQKYKESTEVPISVLKHRFSKLKWKDENLIVHDAATEDNIITLISDMLRVVDGDVNIDINTRLTKLKSHKIDQFLSQHGRCRHYSFQLKKCAKEECRYCTVLNKPRLPDDVFQKLRFVPDPTLVNDEYKPFDDLYEIETDDSSRPSLSYKPENTQRDKQFKKLLVGTKVRGFIICVECGKSRVVYGDKRLSPHEEMALKRVQEEVFYVCGSTLFTGQYKDTIIVKEGVSCNCPMEVNYYSGVTLTFDKVCFHCGDTEIVENDTVRQRREHFGIVRPICQTCLDGGKPIITRNALKVKSAKK